jgi:acetylornithine/succinyldiaminopimelate/putrescine aminotransferase
MLGETIRDLLVRQTPNLFRLYLNSHAAGACVLLTQAVARTWGETADDWRVYLANGGDDALSGAIKLARYANGAEGRSFGGLLLDPHRRLASLFCLPTVGGPPAPLVPGLDGASDPAAARRLLEDGDPPGLAVIEQRTLREDFGRWAPVIRRLAKLPRPPRWIVVAERDDVAAALRRQPAEKPPFSPEVVVFDESYVNGELPFGAFAARKPLDRNWLRRGMATFHSTTFQPNAIASSHVVRCCEQFLPELHAECAAELQRLAHDAGRTLRMLERRYDPKLARWIAVAGFGRLGVRAAGHYVLQGRRRVFDGVAGVACSLRGHNPPDFLDELARTPDRQACQRELAGRLKRLTGLGCFLPASSGAAAVECGLRIGLAAQPSRPHVLALQGGYSGKTLFALAGTSSPKYKRGVGPLYPHVAYVDPFAADAPQQLERACRELPVGVVLFELVQGVGGVRALPDPIVRTLERVRASTGCLLLADEIQTGMFRTGPFARSTAVGLQPDIMTVGKAVSDMMIPFSLALYSEAVRDRLADQRIDFEPSPDRTRRFALGYRTLLNSLRRCDASQFTADLQRRGDLLAACLRDQLSGVRSVRDVRCYGLLVGVELDCARGLRRRIRRLLPQLYLLRMLRNAKFPLLMGFCQYLPHVLKFTPPLSVADAEIVAACEAIGAALRTPLPQLLLEAAVHAQVRPQLQRLGRAALRLPRGNTT